MKLGVLPGWPVICRWRERAPTISQSVSLLTLTLSHRLTSGGKLTDAERNTLALNNSDYIVGFLIGKADANSGK